MNARLIAPLILGLVILAPAVGTAQSTVPSGLPTATRDLWPERPLSPAEEDLRDRIVVLRDSLHFVESTAARLNRGLRGSPAVTLATGRTLNGDCQAAARATAVMREFAAGLSTDNAKWGDKALEDFRSTLAKLERSMNSCDATTAKAVASSEPDIKALGATQVQAVAAIRDYDRAVKGLLRTLKIRLDPRGVKTPTLN
jgi:hypothetical protein